MTTTKKGLELARKLAPAIGYTSAIDETCSKICRAAATLHRLNEEDCNGHPAMGNPNIPIDRANRLQEMWERRIERQTGRILSVLEHHVAALPETDSGPFTLIAEEDPRGCSVLLAPEDVSVRSDSWGHRNGVCIP